MLMPCTTTAVRPRACENALIRGCARVRVRVQCVCACARSAIVCHSEEVYVNTAMFGMRQTDEQWRRASRTNHKRSIECTTCLRGVPRARRRVPRVCVWCSARSRAASALVEERACAAAGERQALGRRCRRYTGRQCGARAYRSRGV